MDSIDRRTRGAAHGPDHEVMLRLWRLVVSDTSTGSGLRVRRTVGPRRAAGRHQPAHRHPAALGGAGRRPTDETEIGHVTAANEWAIDVGLAARLDLHQEGYLALRNMKPPAPYLHNGVFL